MAPRRNIALHSRNRTIVLPYCHYHIKKEKQRIKATPRETYSTTERKDFPYGNSYGAFLFCFSFLLDVLCVRSDKELYIFIKNMRQIFIIQSFFCLSFLRINVM